MPSTLHNSDLVRWRLLLATLIFLAEGGGRGRSGILYVCASGRDRNNNNNNNDLEKRTEDARGRSSLGARHHHIRDQTMASSEVEKRKHCQGYIVTFFIMVASVVLEEEQYLYEHSLDPVEWDLHQELMADMKGYVEDANALHNLAMEVNKGHRSAGDSGLRGRSKNKRPRFRSSARQEEDRYYEDYSGDSRNYTRYQLLVILFTLYFRYPDLAGVPILFNKKMANRARENCSKAFQVIPIMHSLCSPILHTSKLFYRRICDTFDLSILSITFKAFPYFFPMHFC